MRDSSLRTPKGLKAKVLEIKILNFSNEKISEISRKKSFSSFQRKNVWQQLPERSQKDQNIFRNPFLNQKNSILGKDIFFENPNLFSLRTKNKKEKSFFVPLVSQNPKISFFRKKERTKGVVQTGETYFQKPEKVQVYLVEKRKIQVGDKMSGRHGNKGIVSQILPVPDMPFLPDGTPLDMVLNPLGVPSRMNVGQIYECILGLASKYLQQYYRIQPFDEIYGPQASRSFTFSKLYEARKKTSQKWLFNPCYPGKIQIFDGRTGEPYENPVTVGVSYILKLVHLVDDKIHARSTGPYSLVTQQPLKGRSKYGGQRLGEMEVWAIEAYGAAFVLLEMLTIKSDDISGRMTLWSNILLNMPIYIGTPESFKVLVCELQALCLDMGLYRLNKKGFLTQIEHLMQLS
jgi:DNA-directed RNA polymerase subunit beta